MNGRRSTCKSEDIIDESKYYLTKKLSFNFKVFPGKYILLCCLSQKGLEAPFTLSFNSPVKAIVLPEPIVYHQFGSWTDPLNGGYLSTSNPQFPLIIQESGEFVISLSVTTLDSFPKGAAIIVFVIPGNNMKRRKMYTSSEILAKSIFLRSPTVNVDISLEAGEYVVIPCLDGSSNLSFDVSVESLVGKINNFLPAISEVIVKKPEMDCQDFLSHFKSDGIFFEEDIAPALIEYLKQNDAVFRDSSFPPDESSIYDRTGSRQNCLKKNIISSWKRTCEIFDNPSMYVDGIDVKDIIQSNYLGNCWLCQGIAASATSPDRIQQLFSPNYYNEYGVYSVKLFHEGVFQYVLVDDYIPCLEDGSLAFAKSEDANEIWAIILEKAFAKVFKSYEGLTSNDPSVALTYLTGGAVDSKVLDSNDNLWERMKEFSTKKWIMALTTSSNPDSAGNVVDESGIVSNHAYSLINAFELPEENVKLIQVRNTWGHSEWKGDWSDKSDKWTDGTRKIVNYEDKDDGIFYMTYEDMCSHFKYISFCQITTDDYPYSYIAKSEFSIGQGSYGSTKNPKFVLRAEEDCKVIIRFNLKNEIKKPLRVFLCQGTFPGKTLDSNEILFESKYIESKKVILECSLKASPQQYVIYVTLDTATTEALPFTLSVSSTKSLSFNEPYEEPYPFLSELKNQDWIPCGGYMSSSNPKFELIVEKNDKSNQKTETIISLERTDGGSPKGLRIAIIPYSKTLPAFIREENCIFLSKYICTNIISLSATLSPSKYIILICLQNRDMKGVKFQLEVKSTNSIQLKRTA